jgi:HSP20 family protein
MATLVRFDPFREVAAMQNEMSRLLGGFREANGSTERGWVPALDVWETDSDYVYAFDLPGIPEDKIAVEFEDGMLTVSAERERTEHTDSDRFYRFERRFGTFSRAVGLPPGTDESKVDASVRDGVLEIRVAKPEVQKPKKIRIGASHPTIESETGEAQ